MRSRSDNQQEGKVVAAAYHREIVQLIPTHVQHFQLRQLTDSVRNCHDALIN